MPQFQSPLAQAFDLSGRVAVVTGGSRGLGKAMCWAFARCGADVVVASRKQDACLELAAEIAKQTGVRALGIGCHVGSWEACGQLADRVAKELGGIDILVNNAGMSPRYPSLPEVSEELFDKVIAVNLKGPFRLSSIVGARMAAAAGGTIINVSSIAAVQPSAIEIPYAAAKAGLNNLTIGLARALAPKVRVNCIMPGPFMTDISDAWSDEMKNAMFKVVPLGRGGAPDEIVGAALYLASDASSYTTGAVLKIDGGTAFAPA